MEIALPVIAAVFVAAGTFALVRRSIAAGTVFIAVAALALVAGAAAIGS